MEPMTGVSGITHASQAAELMMSGTWLNPGEISKLHRRLKRTRTKTSKACANCRKNKHGCDEGRPCSRCTKKGLPCVSEEDLIETVAMAKQQELVERPIKFQGTLVLSERGNPFLRMRARQLPNHASQVHWMMGHHENMLQRMMLAVPDIVRPVARAAMTAFKVLMAPTKPEPACGELSLLSRALQKCPEKELSEAAQTSCPRMASFVMWIDKGAFVREGVAVSDSVASITGIHPEEVCARVANHDVPIPLSEVDGFCTVMDDLLNGMDPCVVRYVKWKKRFMNGNSSDQKDWNLVRWTRYNVCEDAANDVWCIKNEMEIISPEEFEAVRQAKPGMCRPLTDLLGDRRTAQELMSKDQRMDSWQGYLSTPQGVARLHEFARAVYERFAPVIKMAETVSGAPIEKLMEGDHAVLLPGPAAPMAATGSPSSTDASPGETPPPIAM